MNFEPGEFERLYAVMPTVGYVLDHGMTPMDFVVMGRVVQAIRRREPEFDLKIADGRCSRSWPHREVHRAARGAEGTGFGYYPKGI